MMAFFLLLWLVSIADKNTLQGIAQYFTPTESISDKAGLGFDGGVDTNLEEGIGAPHVAASSLIYGSPSKGHRVDTARSPSNANDLEKDNFLKIIQTMEHDATLQKYLDNIHIDITDDGLRIQITDSDNRSIFKPNTSVLQPYIKQVVNVIGKIIGTQPNYISITGHTSPTEEIKPKNGDAWSLSSDRANEMRKYMARGLIEEDQVLKIISKADNEPFDPKDPLSVHNVRVDITLLNNESVSSHYNAMPQR